MSAYENIDLNTINLAPGRKIIRSCATLDDLLDLRENNKSLTMAKGEKLVKEFDRQTAILKGDAHDLDKGAYKYLAAAASKNETRLALTLIHVEKVKGQNTAVTTDGWRLHMATVSDDIPEGNYEHADATIWQTGVTKDTRYPDFNAIIPKDTDLDKRMMILPQIPGLSKMAEVVKASCARAEVKHGTGPLFTEIVPNGTVHKLQSPDVSHEGIVDVAVNPQYIIDAYTDGATVGLSVEKGEIKRGRPITIESEGRKAVIMPMLGNGKA